MAEKELPRWNVTNIFPSLTSDEFKVANQRLVTLTEQLEGYLTEHQISPDADTPLDPALAADIIKGYIEQADQVLRLSSTIQWYIYTFVYTDSFNTEAIKAMSIWQKNAISIQQIENVTFKAWLGKMDKQLPKILDKNPVVKEHAFYLKDTVDQSRYLMSAEEEAITAELSLIGASAWGKLQSTITSQLKWNVEQEDGEFKELPLTAILNYSKHENETMRKRGYEAELEAWKSVENQLTACMNGVKGQQSVLNRRRGRKDDLHASLELSKIDQETLNAMLDAMKNSFPMFRRYFKSKAKKLGKETLPWWDIFAPMGKMERTFSYPEAQEFVLESFATFSPHLSDFAKEVFDKNWVDVGPREGKAAGAYCMPIFGLEESRILLNFESNLYWVFTLAHELGHSFHVDCLKGKSMMQLNSPLTLNETASILCETIVTDAVIKKGISPLEELAFLDNKLIATSQFVVDSYSRYLFESEVFKRRAKAELSPEELNEIMTWSQKETYGDGLDEKYLQPYMWTWKPHYYFPDFSFYNYPYTFGLLFSTGLYAIYKERGKEFVPQYIKLLSRTGMDSAADLANVFDINIRSPEFWQASLDMIGEYITRYEAL